jgi:hypothetical protein
MVADEIRTNGEGLRQPVGAGLRKTRRVLRRAERAIAKWTAWLRYCLSGFFKYVSAG